MWRQRIGFVASPSMGASGAAPICWNLGLRPNEYATFTVWPLAGWRHRSDLAQRRDFKARIVSVFQMVISECQWFGVATEMASSVGSSSALRTSATPLQVYLPATFCSKSLSDEFKTFSSGSMR